MSVHLSVWPACNSAAVTGSFSVKFGTGLFCENLLRNSKFEENRTKLSDTLHENLNTFYICLRLEFAIKAYMCNTQYFHIVDSDIYLNDTHRMHCLRFHCNNGYANVP